MVGVVPNAAYRHFAGRDELLAAVCTAAMRELAGRMAAGVARVPGQHGDPAAARGRPARDRHGVPGVRPRGTGAVRDRIRPTAAARLRRSRRRDRPGAHAPGAPARRAGRTGRRRGAPAAAPRRHRIPQCAPVLHTVHGLAVLAGKGRCATSPTPPAVTSRTSPAPSSTRAWRNLRTLRARPGVRPVRRARRLS